MVTPKQRNVGKPVTAIGIGDKDSHDPENGCVSTGLGACCKAFLIGSLHILLVR